MAIKKQYLKTKPVCKVTFEITAPEAEKVVVAGGFNNWDESSFELKKLKSGVFKGKADLEVDKKYQFKYIVDGSWENDEDADELVGNQFNSTNSVISL